LNDFTIAPFVADKYFVFSWVQSRHDANCRWSVQLSCQVKRQHAPFCICVSLSAKDDRLRTTLIDLNKNSVVLSEIPFHRHAIFCYLMLSGKHQQQQQH